MSLGLSRLLGRPISAFVCSGFLLCLLLAGGCGGDAEVGLAGPGGGNSLVQPTVQIAWPAQGRAVSGPASALSVRVAVGGLMSGDFVESAAQTFDRESETSAHKTEYKFTTAVEPGSRVVVFKFFAGRGGAGSLVGDATGFVLMGSDGTINLNLDAATKVARVSVIPGQSLAWQDHKVLSWDVRDANGQILAINPSTAVWRSEDAASLRFEGSEAVGVMGGPGQPTTRVTATVDGIASSPVQVVVNPKATVIQMASRHPSGLIAEGLSRDGTTVLGRANGRAATWRIGSAGSAVPMGPPGSEPVAISRDGSTVLCSVGFDRYFVTGPAGTDEIPFPEGTTDHRAFGISGDGLSVVCAVAYDTYYRWTRAHGMQKLFQNGIFAGMKAAEAAAISSDGEIVAGALDSSTIALWIAGFETPLSDSVPSASPIAVADRTAGGLVLASSPDRGAFTLAGLEIHQLPLMHHANFGVGSGMSADGTVIGGAVKERGDRGRQWPVIWTNGAVEDFNDVLAGRYGYQGNPAYGFDEVRAISDDKKVFLVNHYIVILQ